MRIDESQQNNAWDHSLIGLRGAAKIIIPYGIIVTLSVQNIIFEVKKLKRISNPISREAQKQNLYAHIINRLWSC